MVLAGYVIHFFVGMHHRHSTFSKHSSQLVPFLLSQLGRGVVAGGALLVDCVVAVVEDCVVVDVAVLEDVVLLGAAVEFCASVELKPKTSRTRGIKFMFSSLNERILQ